MRNQGAQQVRRGVEAHVALAARPVDVRARPARRQSREQRFLPGSRHVDDSPGAAPCACRRSRPAAIGQFQRALVAGLAAAMQVEHRAVELHTGVDDGGDRRLHWSRRRRPGRVRACVSRPRCIRRSAPNSGMGTRSKRRTITPSPPFPRHRHPPGIHAPAPWQHDVPHPPADRRRHKLRQTQASTALHSPRPSAASSR